MDISCLTKEQIDSIPYNTETYLCVDNILENEYVIKYKILDNKGNHVADSLAHWELVETVIYPISPANIGNT